MLDVAKTLKELCRCYGPPGEEDEVVDYCRPILERTCDRVWQDEVGNLIGFIEGTSKREGDSVRIFAHLDEISLIIKRIEEDGQIRVDPLGGIYPSLLGAGPLEILGRKERQMGVLGIGSVHISEESSPAWETQPFGGNKAMEWHHTRVFTGLTRQQLYDKGIRAGTRVVLPHDRRTFTELDDYWGAFFFDDRVAVAAVLSMISEMKELNEKPFPDLYIVFTVEEEVGAHGAKFASRTIPGTLTIGLEVGPAEKEYSVDFNASPIIVYRDEEALYDRRVANHFLDLADSIGLHVQTATFSTYKSDASHAKSIGYSPFSTLLCLPTMNTHGYEIVHKQALPNLVTLMKSFFVGKDCGSLLERFCGADTRSLY